MKKTGLILLGAIIISSLNAKEFTLTQSAPFDILTMSYKECEQNALKQIEKEVITHYIGCQTDVSAYDIKVTFVEKGRAKIEQKSCNVEATFDVTSDYLDSNPQYLGKKGSLCGEYQSDSLNSFEVGLYGGVSGSHEEVELKSDDKSITLNYSHVTLVGLNIAYMHRILSNQHIGVKAIVAKGFETYTTSDVSTPREDGDPSITRLGAGLFWNYRYYEQVEFKVGANILMDAVTRNYINNSYTANVTSFNAEATIGYYVLPSVKIWTALASDISANVGISYVY